ncbi:hypothetical protein N7510_007162 [Penicillium lagena]|uniref:uncharacterized protein n=1 Tax=Penicillium lagena TaxID=94218 RepID=UPI0025423B86|nr:uncharacterized protein N7510_007162 [Penicillium lagena]KAJ5610443.1 hypothetical protein N7510_007162 [Penicillium lagena]
MAGQTLEGLPAELLILILFEIRDRQSLQSVVLASPACHKAYLMIRPDLLYCILKNQYDELLLPEAIAAIRSKGLDMKNNREKAIALLDIRRRDKEINASEPASLEEIIELLHFHKEIHFFLDDYSQNAPRPEWIDSAQWPRFLPLDLSNSEKCRFLRALCRLQTHAYIFGKSEVSIERWYDWPSNDWEYTTLRPEDAWRLFFGTILPWEYEEMGCVWSYLMTKYDPVYKEISDSLNNCGVNFFWDLPKDQRPNSVVVERVEDLEILPDCTDTLVSIGPRFLYRVLHADDLRRRNLVMANANTEPETWIGPNCGVSSDYKFPFLYPADLCNVGSFNELWSALPSLEQPNLGWTVKAVEKFRKERYFEFAIVESHCDQEWDWGYAIWDGERLRKWEAPLLKDEKSMS